MCGIPSDCLPVNPHVIGLSAVITHADPHVEIQESCEAQPTESSKERRKRWSQGGRMNQTQIQKMKRARLDSSIPASNFEDFDDDE